MAANVLQSAANLLIHHYGDTEVPGPPGAWATLVRIVLESGRSVRKSRDWSWIGETPLADPDETLGQNVGCLAEILEAAGQSAAKAHSLHRLAAWWQRCIGDSGSNSQVVQVFPTRSVESWQEDLRAIPGVNWDLADRILLFVGGRTVYPLDRGSLRIAVRHGWMDPSDEYDDWQAFFKSVTRDSALDLALFSSWNAAVARDFCKAKPDCEECPLKSLLPARGVVALDEDGD